MKRKGTICCVVLFLLGSASAATTAPSTVGRLRVKAAKSTIAVGETTSVVVEFLSGDYERAANDRDRVVTFELRSIGGSQGTVAEISPSEVRVAAGADSAQASLTGKAPGRLTIQAGSRGLAPARTLVSVSPRRERSWSLVSAAHAQPPPEVSLEIFPEEPEAAPANDKSPISLWVLADQAVGPGQRLDIRFTVNPLTMLRYGGESRPGLLSLSLAHGELQSDTIEVFSSEPRTVRATARLVPAGADVSADLTFFPPKPHSIFFHGGPEEMFTTNQREVSIRVGLEDQDRVATEILEVDYHIDLRPLTDPEAIELVPGTLVLSPDRASGVATLRIRSMPPQGEIRLQARDQSEQLEAAEKKIGLESRIKKVIVQGPAEVFRGGQSVEITLQLADAEGKLAKADLDRTFTVIADRGTLLSNDAAGDEEHEHGPSELADHLHTTHVTILQDQEDAHVKFLSPPQVAIATIRVESPGLEPAIWKVQVTTKISTLLLIAGLGGVLGGTARQFYKQKVGSILPRKVGGHIQMGLLGNAAFSFLFGIVFFLAIKFGALDPLPSFIELETPYGELRRFAVFLGVLGGFGGIDVLARLVRRFLPGDASPAPTPSPG